METKLCLQARPLASLGENPHGARSQHNRRVQLIANGARAVSLMNSSPKSREGNPCLVIW